MTLKTTVWRVAIRNTPQGSILQNTEDAFIPVPNPKGGWAADPFLWETGDALYIFAELFSYRKWRGNIGVCRYKNGEFSEWKEVLHEGHHFSFPNLIKTKDGVLMVPEASSADEIPTYICTHFPDKWRKSGLLYCGEKMVDSIFLNDTDLLSYRIQAGSQVQLVLLKPNEEGKLVPVDERNDINGKLRPGGKAFRFHDWLLRPTQDCNKFYGEALDFVSVDYDGENLPREELIKRVEVSQLHFKGIRGEVVGIHTYNATENYEVVDFQSNQWVPLALMKRLSMRIWKE